MAQKLTQRIGWPLLLATLLTACSSDIVNPVTGQAERSVMSEQMELTEGAKAHQQVLQEYGVDKDARLQAYVNSLGQRLAKLSHRDQELQADSLGAEYLARTAYDPRNMVNVINSLKSQERFAADQARASGRAAPAANSWLSSHPSNDQRLQQISQLATQYQDNYVDEGRARYLQAIAGMAFGESTGQGLTRGQNFYHADLGIAITAPAGWQIQNEPSQLALFNARTRCRADGPGGTSQGGVHA